MADRILEKLGSYEVLRELGRGGMGIVHLARDPNLDRQVAIKVLPTDVAADPARLARFEREARTIAAVNHPNIATIHALEQSEDGSRFIVMEFIEGLSLSSRLEEGSLEVADALRIGRQIASALASAHERGITHRDLKPSNVMFSASGQAKVLDFGLAKENAKGEAHLASQAPTMTQRVTQPGAVMGTPGYMSPEQARGLSTDARTDVFSFGCVLYECLSGSCAFVGGTPSDVMAEVLTVDPKWTVLPDETPSSVLELLIRCTAKDVNERLSELSHAVDVLDKALAGRRPSSSSRLTALSAPPNNLPASVTSFVGREGELVQLAELIDRSRQVTLSGSGGCGKTRLALKFAERQLPAFPDGVWFVALGGVSDPALVQQTMLSALGLKDEAGKPTLATLTDHLRDQHVLLLLDNCEHLLETCAELVETLLQSCPGLKVLVTSRQSMGTAGESTFHVPSLSVPKDLEHASADEILACESVKLFIDRASAASSRFQVTEAIAPIVAQIVAQLDGIPLAIELAAARVKAMPVGQIARRLDDSFRLLRGGSKTALERHQTLQATIDWSYSLLAEEEQTLLRRLAVFSGGWTLEAGEQVCAGDPIDELDVLDLLSQLVEKSLVVYEEKDESARYRLLETMRQYALAKLIEKNEAKAVRDRHLEFFVALAEQAEPHLRSSVEWIGRTIAEQENIVGAHQWCMTSDDHVEDDLSMLGSAFRLWDVQGRFGMGLTVLSEALAHPAAQVKTPARAKTLFGAGALATRLGAYDQATGVLEEAIELGKELGDLRIQGAAFNALAIVDHDHQRLEVAREMYEKGLAAFREAGDETGIALTLGNLGELCLDENKRDEARELLQEAVKIGRQCATLTATALPDQLRTVAQLCTKAGDLDTAAGHLTECIRLVQEFSTKLYGTMALEACANLALAKALAEDDDRRQEHLEVSAAIIGAADSLRTTMGAPVPPGERQARSEMIDALRTHLGTDGFAEANGGGRGQSFAAATKLALDWLESLTS